MTLRCLRSKSKELFTEGKTYNATQVAVDYAHVGRGVMYTLLTDIGSYCVTMLRGVFGIFEVVE